MAARNIYFSEYSPEIQKLLNQVFRTLLSQAFDLPVMFSMYSGNDEPTQAEIDHATEILRLTVLNQVIYYGTEAFISESLRFVIWDIENWIGGRDESQTVEEAMEEYSMRFGIDVSSATLIELKCLARSICPHSEIGVTRRVTDKETLSNCIAAFNKAISDKPTIDYGQNNIGIVVDGVMYDFPADHPALPPLLDLLQSLV